MAEGYDIRQPVQDPNAPNGNVNKPARQLAGFNVSPPRGGDMSAVGSEYKVLAEAMRMGGQALGGYLEKQEAKDRVNGEMNYAEGKTEADLQKAGVSRATLEGYKGLKAKTAANEWFVNQAASIDSQWAQRPTEEFKAHLQSQFAEMTDAMDPNDEYGRKMIGEVAGDMFGKLVSQQVLKNSEWAKTETISSFSNLIVSEAQAGDKGSLHEIVNNADKLMPNATPEERREAQLRGVRERLNEGDTSVLEALGGIDGIRKLGATEAEMSSITNAQKQGQTVNETKYMTQIGERQNAILLNLKETGNVQDAQDQLAEMQADFNLRPEFMRSMYNQVQAEDFGQKLTQQETAKLYNPEYLDDMTQLAREAKFGLLEGDALNKRVQDIATKYQLSPDMIRKNYEIAQSHRQQFVDEQDRVLLEQARKVQDQRELDRKGTALLNNRFGGVDAEDNKVVQNAFNQQRQLIAQKVMQSPQYSTDEERASAMIKQHVDFLRNVPQRDEQLKRDFNSATQGTPIDEKGMVRPDVLNAFQYMEAMRDAGLSERIIKDYVGEGYDYLSTAVDVGTGVNDPKTALASAWQIMENKNDGQVIATDPVKAKIAYDEEKAKYFDDLEPSMISAWLGAESGSQYDEVLTDQVAEAAANSSDMDAWMTRRIRAISMINPKMKQDAVISLAKKDMSQWEYVLGNMVRPSGTKTVSQAMGVTDIPGALVSNAALLTYLRDKGDKMWPEGTEERNWWTVVKDAGSDAANTVVFQPEKIAYMLGANRVGDNIKDTTNHITAFSEKDQRLRNQIKMVDVDTLQNGSLIIQLYQDPEKTRPVGMPVIVPAKEVGDYYKARRKEQYVDDNLVKKRPKR